MVIVSIIIPVYNVEKYLKECLDSAKNQTVTDIEIICIDDGSTDSSGAICDQFAAADSRFVVIHQANAGQSAARTKGLNIARGEFILFMDSDDKIDSRLIETALSSFTEEQIDIVQYGLEMFDLENKTLPSPFRGVDKTVSETKEKISLQSDFWYFIWNKMYRREFIERYNLRFLGGCLFEDNHFAVKCAILAQKIRVIPDKMYFYRYGCGYSTNNQAKRKQIGYIKMFKLMVEDFIKSDFPESIINQAEARRFNQLRYIYRKEIPADMKTQMKQEILESLSGNDWALLLNPEFKISSKVRAFYFWLKGETLYGVWIRIKYTWLNMFYK